MVDVVLENERVSGCINRSESDDRLCQRKAGHPGAMKNFKMSHQMSVMMTQKITRSRLKRQV